MIPAFNAEETILSTLNSVASQLYRPIELIIIDDGSTDRTPQVVERWIADTFDPNITIIYRQQPHRGLIAGRRAALQLSSGVYLQFLDADDLLHPRKFAECVPHLESGFDVVVPKTLQFHDYIEIQEALCNPFPRLAWTRSEIFWDTSSGTPWRSVGPLFSRPTIEKAGDWRDTSELVEELDLHARVKLQKPKVLHLDQVLSFRRKGRSSAMTGSLERVYAARVMGGHLLVELLTEREERGIKEWLSLAYYCLRTYWQILRRREDPILQKSARKAFATCVLKFLQLRVRAKPIF